MSQFMQSVNQSRARGSRSGFEFQANICIEVTGYDLAAPDGARVLGIARAPAWAQGQEFSIRLQNEQESKETFRKGKDAKANDKFFKTRPSIENLANGYKVGKNTVEPMQEGGFLMLYGCVRDGKTNDGEPQRFKAQYPQNFGNDPSRSVMAGVARITYREERVENGRTFGARGQMEILSPEHAAMITSIDGLRNFYADFMAGEVNGVQYDGMVALRLVEDLPAEPGKDVRSQVYTGFAYAAKSEVQVPAGEETRTIRVPASAEESFAALAGREGVSRLVYAALSGEREGLEAKEAQQADQIAADLAAGALRVEAIPGRVLPIVGDSLEEVMDKESMLGKNASRCQYQTEDGKSLNGFVRLTTGVMTKAQDGAPDSIIVTRFATDVGAKGMSINSVVTPNVKPVWGQSRERAAEQAAAKAAEQGADATQGVDYNNDRGHQADAPAMDAAEPALAR